MIPPISESSNHPICSPKREYIAGGVLVIALGAIGAGVYFAVTGNLGPSAYAPMLAAGGVAATISTIALVVFYKRRKTEEHPPKTEYYWIGDNRRHGVNLVWDEKNNRYKAEKTPDPITLQGTSGTNGVYVWDDINLGFYIQSS